MILVKDKDLVVPGQILAENDYYPGMGTFKEDSRICSSLVGLVSVRNKRINVIPLQSKYIPKRGDVIIGEITDIRFSMWGLDINSPYTGMLPASEVFGKDKRELEKVFEIGDVLLLRVVDVDEVKKVKLGLKGRGLGKFRDGILVYITPTKVPRLIGKRGSMINMVKEKTGCDIVVGQNGVVWIKGDPQMERIAEKVILMIDREAHTSGLTDRVRELLDKLTVSEEETPTEHEGETYHESGEAPPEPESTEEKMEEEESPDLEERDEEETSEGIEEDSKSDE
ncbi:exosome complex RNA-binding protein Rrp4 [Methanothermobacter sp. THM-2]|uniref:exosome complex RNA-binding protein Rrp4 n=1 Tax=Methanothermobacter TaxID=145260 RepID=UPI00092D901A|nr:exosome complex RNA-binding protein Rrp4 [Methanothermobacter sp. THM-2]NLM03153.1 exosome complex protein Rrp4 [Methanothermobacter wolfeii]QHN07508.1 exosome complex protein Rrp4 [Methanothermobacter sp. THM-2]SCM57418.1 Exosome complex component Rrp4 {ECO:0000255/HAMAP-Rule:MF_00623} [Methanothermobacter wolfeii]